MADYGIKVSQDGFNVGTCADKDLVMSSAFNMLKTAATGVMATAGTVSHGLTYAPLFFSSRDLGTTTCTLIGDDRTYCNTANLITIHNGIRYYIFYQQF